MQSSFQTIIVGAGIAGLVSALELLQQGKDNILIVDRDTKARVGGLARWAFGGMALCNTEEQRRQKIPDSPERLLKDWHSFAQFSNSDHWPKAWAKCYAQDNYQWVYLWLKSLGCKFLPAVNWVERGLNGEGNSVPRYHVLWGTGWHLVETVMTHLQPYVAQNKLTFLHQHKVIDINIDGKSVSGVSVTDEVDNKNVNLNCQHLIIACGGINGSIEKVKEHWNAEEGKSPDYILNGASPLSDGKLHDLISRKGGKVTRQSDMWNYAAGIHHPKAEFEGHGLSLIPCKSALWLNHLGERIGPMPLITGFDTNDLCQQVAKQDKPWTWQVLNWKIALKELAVSGSAHNPSIKDHKLFSFLKEILFGNKRLVNQLMKESSDFIVADNLETLTARMNEQTNGNYLQTQTLENTIRDYDSQFSNGLSLTNDDQIRRILHCRQWRPDKLRTLKPSPILAEGKGPLIAIKLHLISRKSLGGVQTNLSGQVLGDFSQPIDGLYAVGEAAGFGGGGMCGKRSLEGTFLSACILTARKTAEAIARG